MIPMDRKYLDGIIARALKEDKAGRDITTALLISGSQNCRAEIIFKEDAVICGVEIVHRVFQRLDRRVRFSCGRRDGQKVKKNTKTIHLEGKARALLSGERTALNFLSYLSGIAMRTSQYVEKVSPYPVKILDTRKTTPGLRILEKYAVRCGGGFNHRWDLSEVVFIKDNHRAALGEGRGLAGLIPNLRKKTPSPIIIEVDNLEQFYEVLPARPDIILLDNMPIEHIREAVRAARKLKPSRRPLLEASGGITLANIRAIARTGVERISIGALTHGRQSVDISMELHRL